MRPAPTIRKPAVRNALAKAPGIPGAAKHIHFEEVDSTNSWALKHADEWAPHGLTLVTASAQTAGRGRLHRRWLSPPALNLYASFCFYLDEQRGDAGHLPQLLALSALIELETRGFLPTLKWPNDLLLSNKKAAGLLCETFPLGRVRGIVCGIGLNVNMPPELLNGIGRPATSLLVESGRLWALPPLLEDISTRFGCLLQRFLNEGFAPFFFLFREKLAVKKGERIAFHTPKQRVEALFEELCSDGSIVLRLSNGKLERHYTGEIVETGGER